MTEHILYTGDIDDSFLMAGLSATILACDCETSGLDWQKDRLGLVQIYVPSTGVALVRPTPEINPTRLIRLFEEPVVRKVFHHAMFDLRFLVHLWEFVPKNIACTKIMAKLINPHAKNSLKDLLARYLNVQVSKAMQISNWLDPTLSDEQIEYAVSDVLNLASLFCMLSDQLAAQGMLDLGEGCFNHLPTRVRLELLGYPDVFEY